MKQLVPKLQTHLFCITLHSFSLTTSPKVLWNGRPLAHDWYWIERLVEYLLLSFSEKVHYPEVPEVQPSWVCSQMDKALTQPWLLVDWATWQPITLLYSGHLLQDTFEFTMFAGWPRKHWPFLETTRTFLKLWHPQGSHSPWDCNGMFEE